MGKNPSIPGCLKFHINLELFINPLSGFYLSNTVWKLFCAKLF